MLLVGILCSGEQRSVHTLVWFQLIAKAGLWMVESERFLLWCRVLIFVSHSWRGFQMGSAGRGLFQTGAQASPGLPDRLIPVGKPGKEPSPRLVPVLPNSAPRS